MLHKEIERQGIPCALITTLIPAASTVGASRIVQGVAITNPLGNPALPRSREKEIRRKIIEKALEVLRKKIETERVFQT